MFAAALLHHLPRVRKPYLHSDRDQDLNSSAWRPLGSKREHGSTVPRRPSLSYLYVEELSTNHAVSDW
ncbi:hypothetical protein E2C01_001997 [Portunus trituberculatus]|uniref:Uncharacterized protein n=1 Tax=Portunus trituberculatus TaxID=210409 RepID=A0A5B7CLV6_PORTR|nr:hypothetical protein [Portunus trituberculatus]